MFHGICVLWFSLGVSFSQPSPAPPPIVPISLLISAVWGDEGRATREK